MCIYTMQIIINENINFNSIFMHLNLLLCIIYHKILSVKFIFKRLTFLTRETLFHSYSRKFHLLKCFDLRHDVFMQIKAADTVRLITVV